MSWPIPNVWSDEERQRLCEQVARFPGDWSRIAANMPGRSLQACKQAYHQDQRRSRMDQAAPSVAAAPKRLKSWQDKRAKEKAAERERAQALALERSLTSEFFGDPLPGRSALDRKRAGERDPGYFDRRLMHVPKKPTLSTGGWA